MAKYEGPIEYMGPCCDCGYYTDSLVGDVYWCDECLNRSWEEYQSEGTE